MTIALGFITHNGIIMATDSLVSNQISNAYREKLVRCHNGNWDLTFAIAGSEDHALSAIDEVRHFCETNQTASLVEIKQSIENAFRNGAYGSDDPTALIGVRSTGGEYRLMRTSYHKVVEVKSHYSIGMGAQMAHYLLPIFLSNSFAPSIDMERAAIIGSIVVALCKKHIEGCGGATQMAFLPRSIEGTVTIVSFPGPDLSELDNIVSNYDRASKQLLQMMSTLDESKMDDRLVEYMNSLRDMRKDLERVLQETKNRAFVALHGH